jgi:transglutaminase-like putative cysteine protease
MASGAAGVAPPIASYASASGASSPVDRFFELSLLGLLASGFMAVAGSGYLDAPTVVITAVALLARVLLVAGAIRFEFPPIAVTLVTVAYIAFYPVDYFFISRSFIPAAIHLVFFVAVVKILTARSDRDYLFLKTIALLELLAACIVSASFNFFVFLLLFLVLGVATFASSEIRQSRKRAYSPARISAAGVTGRLIGVVLSVSLAILVITAGLFFFLPRTARAAFQHLVSHRYHLAGFSNHVSLGEIGEIKQENVPVMHVKMDRPEDRSLALKWRGAALSEFNGRAWFNRPAAGQILQPDRAGLLRLEDDTPRRGGRYISYAVYLSDLAQDALFFAGTPQYVRIDSLVVRRPYGNYSAQFTDARTVSYQVYSHLDSTAPVAEPWLVEALAPDARKVYLQLPRLDPRIPELARNIVHGQSLPAMQALLLEKYLHANYGYTLQLPQVEPDDPLAFFLFHRKKGHCEYFASALAVMLRVIGIPSRVITGFESGVYNPISGSQLIRSSDAHSWVEAWLPDRGWTTFDPTPPDPNASRLSSWTRLTFYADAVDVFWQDWVLNYSLERQLQLASRVGESGRHIRLNWSDGPGFWSARNWSALRDFARRYGFLLLGLLALAALGKFLGRDGWRWWATRRRLLKVQRGGGHPSDATLLYERMLKALRRRGIEKPAWLTPCEFARVLQEPELSLLVEDFTSAYNELRFGGNAEAAGRIFVLLERLETAS